MSTAVTHQIVLGTKAAGMDQIGVHYEGHRIIEISAVEVVNRRLMGNNFRIHPRPDWLVDPETFGMHDITDEFLLGKPTFAKVADEFMDYIRSVELVIHNAALDIGFVDYESSLLKHDIPKINTSCKAAGSLVVTRKMFPGKRNSFDTLCVHYEVDNSKRALHGALFDAQILAEVYLAVTGGQTSMAFAMGEETQQQQGEATIQRIVR